MKKLSIYSTGLFITLFLLFAFIVMSGPVAAQNEVDNTPGAIESEPINVQDQGTAEAPAGPEDVNAPGVPQRRGMDTMTMIMLGVMVVFLIMMFRGPRKKQQEHRKMVQSLQKNDRVRTIGGIYGTVVDVRDDEIVLKIDESTNTKIKITPSAIGTKISEEKS
ncbi:MAG: preprotein translocase subunit YajC [Phycisphaerae bacterium]|jgi:preprotein translocase subunit YajC